MWENKNQKIQLLRELVSIPSVSRTESEKYFPIFLKDKCMEFNYFKENPEFLKAGDLFFSAFVKGKTDKTILLISHYDVVDTDDYGSDKDLAFDIDKITNKMNYNYSLSNETEEWLYGRGVMDVNYPH